MHVSRDFHPIKPCCHTIVITCVHRITEVFWFNRRPFPTKPDSHVRENANCRTYHQQTITRSAVVVLATDSWYTCSTHTHTQHTHTLNFTKRGQLAATVGLKIWPPNTASTDTFSMCLMLSQIRPFSPMQWPRIIRYRLLVYDVA
jgi:hypothetical protein